MTFSAVLLSCLGGIALCATLIFLVETLVASFGHETHTTGELTRLPTTAGGLDVAASRPPAADFGLDLPVERAA